MQSEENEAYQEAEELQGNKVFPTDRGAGDWATLGGAPTIQAADEPVYSRGAPQVRPVPRACPAPRLSTNPGLSSSDSRFARVHSENDEHAENALQSASVHPTSSWPRRYPLALYLCVFELGYLLLLALSPLPGLHLYASPVATAWPWTLLSSHVLALFGSLISASSGRGWISPLLLSITLLVLVATYTCAMGSVWYLKDEENASERNQDRLRYFILLLGGAFLFSLTLLVQPKLFSDDVFVSIFSGRILAVYHADPLKTAPIQFPADPYFPWVISGRNTPNILGPLWLCIASALVSIGRGPVGTLLLFKGLAILTHLLNCVLIWAILGSIAPARRLLGTLLYAWNPLVLIELAGSGHSEGVLTTLLLFAVWLWCSGIGKAAIPDSTTRKEHWYSISTLIVFGLAISINLITLLLAPLFLWFEVRTERRILYALWGFCWRTLLMLVPVLLIWLPFWHGASTFFTVTSAIGMGHFIQSPIGALAVPIRAFFQFVADLLHFPSFLHPITSADITLRASATFIFALIYIDLFGRVRRAPRTIAGMRYRSRADSQMKLPGFDILLSSWGVAVFWYLVLVSGSFWPWYMLWILWTVVLRRFDAFTSAVLLLSGTALFLYPLLSLPRSPMFSSAPIFSIPLIYLIVVRRREKSKERMTPLS